jgi:flagellar basal-body rod protein FlgB
MPVSDSASLAYQTALRGLAARQRVIATNVANVETPGYIAKRVDFESALEQVVGTPLAGAVTPSVRPSDDPVNPNGNNVNLDQESIGMVDTNLRYQLMVEAMNAKFRLLRTAIRGVA